MAAKGIPGPRRLLTGAASPPLLPVICKQQAPELEPAATLPPLPQPPLAPAAPVAPAQGTPSMDELIQQSQWNLQQQEQHLLALRQVRARSPRPAAPPEGRLALPSAPRASRLRWGWGCPVAQRLVRDSCRSSSAAAACVCLAQPLTPDPEVASPPSELSA